MTPTLHRQVVTGPWKRKQARRLRSVLHFAVFLGTFFALCWVTLQVLPRPEPPRFSPIAGLSIATAGLAPAPVLLGLADVPDPSTNPQNWVGSVLDAIQHSDWRYLAAAFLVGIVWTIRILGGKVWPALATPRGSAILVMVMAFVLAFANALLAKATGGYAPLDLHLLWTALVAGFTASGIWSWNKNVIAPSPPASAPDKEKS